MHLPGKYLKRVGERGKSEERGTAEGRKELFEREAAKSGFLTYIYISKDDRFLEVFILELFFWVSSCPHCILYLALPEFC